MVLRKPSSNQEDLQNAENKDHFYQSVTTEFSQKLLLKKLMKQASVCFDTETTSLNTLEAKLVGIAFSYEKGKGYYVPIPESDEEAKSSLKGLDLSFQ